MPNMRMTYRNTATAKAVQLNPTRNTARVLTDMRTKGNGKIHFSWSGMPFFQFRLLMGVEPGDDFAEKRRSFVHHIGSF